MPVSLLDSQFATLEPPLGEDDVVAIPIGLSTAEQLRLALAALDASD
jgi:Gluconate kinase